MASNSQRSRGEAEASFDVVVAGGGVAGVAVALSAARGGAKVALLERTRILGGTVAHCLIHTLGGLYDSNGEYLNGGTCIELAERLFRADSGTGKRKIGRMWTLGASPEVFREVVESWIGEEENITPFLGGEDVAVDCREGAIRSVCFAAEGRRTSFQTRSVVDATGNAEVIASVDRGLLVEPHHRALGGLIFRIGNIRSEDVLFPRNLRASQKMRRAAEEGILPEEFSRAWIDRGVHDEEAYVKISIPVEGGRAQHLQDYPGTDSIGNLLLSFLRGFPEFSSAKILQAGKMGFRDGGIFLGEYQLTADDVRGGRKFPDAACRCAWPMEFWDQRKGAELEYLAADDFYEVPLRSLKVRGIENLWGAGKCISADPLAQASTRVAGCCWAMGDAVGKALSEKGPERK